MVIMQTPWYETLKDRRLEKHLNVAQLARAAKVSRQTVMAYEAGEVQYPRPHIVASIARKLDLDPALVWLQVTEELERAEREPLILHERGPEYDVASEASPNTDEELRIAMNEAWRRVSADDRKKLIERARDRLPAVEDTGD